MEDGHVRRRTRLFYKIWYVFDRIDCFFCLERFFVLQPLIHLLYSAKFIAADAKKEFDQQVIEYRATGSYQPSKHFERLENSSIWIRKDNPSPLEKEISSYDTILFPKRPPEMDEAYREREIRSITKRRLKLKGLWNEDLKTWREGVDFAAECDKERTKRAKQSHNVDDVEATASV